MYAILSDIHGNRYALEKVTEDMKKFNIDGIILLGDLIDYGMQSNEVVTYIREKLDNKIICNIWGNHEYAILTGDFEGFSSRRGVESAKYTEAHLSGESRKYLDKRLIHEGIYNFTIGNKRILAVHGSLANHYWKAVGPENVWGNYSDYDVVLSGHSHYTHMFSKFYETDDAERRNKHAVLFINPGSVGQPRNHNPAAQYALLDTGTMSVNLRAVEYDFRAEMKLYNGSVDDFYRIRLKNGI